MMHEPPTVCRTLAATLRADVDALQRPELPDDVVMGWLGAAHFLQVLSATPSGNDGEPLRQVPPPVEAALRTSLRPRLDCRRTPSEVGRFSQSIRGIAEAVEDVGAKSLAEFLLLALERFLHFRPEAVQAVASERGRVQAQLGRLAWAFGRVDEAFNRYAEVDRIGRHLREPELRVRACLGRAAIAQVRGQLGDMEREAGQALELAGARLRPLVGLAHHFLLVAASERGDWSGAIVHGWASYRARRRDAADAAQALGNLGQVLLRAGLPTAAAPAFRLALAVAPPPWIQLPVVGSLALASAMLAENTDLGTLEADLRATAAAETLPYQFADTLVDFAGAYAVLGDGPASARCAREARRIAAKNGYEVVLSRLQALTRPTLRRGTRASTELSKEAARVVRAVAHLAA